MIKPIHDNVLVSLQVEAERKIGSIIVTDSEERAYSRGTVAAVGDGAFSEEGFAGHMECRVGDAVVFRRGVGTLIGGFVILKDTEVLAREEREDEEKVSAD